MDSYSKRKELQKSLEKEVTRVDRAGNIIQDKKPSEKPKKKKKKSWYERLLD